MNIVLCDDNPTFLRDLHHRLQYIVAQCDWTCKYTLYQSPMQLLSADLSTTELLFLDIDMPGINGIQTGRKLREKYTDLIIVFVTGYIKYALDGYSVAAFRYLLKDSLDAELPICIRDIQKKMYEEQDSITIRGLEHNIQVRIQDILYLEGTAQRHVMQLDDLSQFPLPDDELVVVLANLLDNAIEACALIPNKSLRYILIKIQCRPAVTYLHVENSTAEPVTIKNNHIVTHKQSSGHGYGLQNIKTILERHQALYTLSYQEDGMIFCFSAQILPN